MLFIRLGDITATELDQDAAAHIVSRCLQHARIVHSHLLAVIADFKLEGFGIELVRQHPLEVRCHNTVGMISHEGLEILAELLQPIA